jgi:hypothetical protein
MAGCAGYKFGSDTRRSDFAEERHRQCLLVAQADGSDAAMEQFMEEALVDLDGWVERSAVIA